jgi:hypothetical protein
MAEPTIADLAKMIEGLTGKIGSLQSDIDALKKEKESSSGASAPGTGHDGQHHTDRPPRFQKLDFPRYDGKSDPLVFINRCESYFHQQRIMEEEKVWMASYNLEDNAQLWYMQVQQDEGVPSWRRFKDLINLRYGPPLRSAPLFELSQCRRTGSVEEYQDRFQALLPRAGLLEETQRVQMFTGGLLPPLSNQVRLHNPQTLAVAMSLAREVEVMEQERLAAAPAVQPGRGGPRAQPGPGLQPSAQRLLVQRVLRSSGCLQKNKPNVAASASATTAMRSTHGAIIGSVAAFSSSTALRSRMRRRRPLQLLIRKPGLLSFPCRPWQAYRSVTLCRCRSKWARSHWWLFWTQDPPTISLAKKQRAAPGWQCSTVHV